jgi:hypothetical protein
VLAVLLVLVASGIVDRVRYGGHRLGGQVAELPGQYRQGGLQGVAGRDVFDGTSRTTATDWPTSEDRDCNPNRAVWSKTADVPCRGGSIAAAPLLFMFVSMNRPRLPMHAGQPAKLRELGYDEIWLQNWLADAPARLGLGEVRIVAQELTAPRGGSLDILAADGDTYYSVEVQLGEVDASHSFRVFDYWARNRMRFEGKTHVAVLVVESAAGRYRSALEALAEYLPLVVIELRAWRGEAEVILVPETVVINQNLDVAGPAGTVPGEARTEADWKASVTPEAWAFHAAFIAWTRANLGEVRVDYSPKSYVGIRRGRRVWAPLWFRKEGATIYLPDPDGLRGEQQSPAMDDFQERLRGEGLETSWQPTYNAGANPVPLRLRQPDLAKPVVQELLKATFAILDSAAVPWSERQAQPTAPAGGDATDALSPNSS